MDTEPAATVVFHADGTSFSTASAADDSDDADFILARVQSAETESGTGSGGATATALAIASFAIARLGSGSSREVDGDKGVSGDQHQHQQLDEEDEVDWDFWGAAMNDYAGVGAPPAALWLCMSGAKDAGLETTYRALLTRASSHEKIIQRDLARTFPTHDHFADANGPGQESLFHVLKAYSLYDPEVGYCQGIAFITGPLLLNMPDEEAFCVLEKLMKSYNFRDLYTPKMLGLQLRLFQFDKLLKEMFPAIYNHLDSHDVKSTMYASQWFMTLFAYRFPLEVVFRIMDILFAQGLEVTFKFAFALLKKNQDHILQLTDLEHLLDFLKIGLFTVYEDNVNLLISEASAIHISKRKMDKLALEHQEEIRRNNPELLTGDALKGENRRLNTALKKLEEAYETLNREHIDLAKQHIEIQTIKDRALQKAEENEITLQGLKSVLSSERNEAERQVKEEMDRLAQKNFELTQRNGDLEDQVDHLEAVVRQQAARLMELENTVNTLRGH
ncbi:rab-GTPase-TBC domain-containing protein [Obelidium mucronatum]|nr:rab-GTPase-TBC domain-containing protein [Obelidium mucronatum]